MMQELNYIRCGDYYIPDIRLPEENRPKIIKTSHNGGFSMKIEHIALYVNDLEAAKDFFVKYFGAVPGERYHNEKTDFCSYFLSFDDGARIEIMTKPDICDEKKNPARTGYAHLAFSSGSKEAVDELTEKLKADGFEVLSDPRTTGDGYYESCIVGFEGNIIEITI